MGGIAPDEGSGTMEYTLNAMIATLPAGRSVSAWPRLASRMVCAAALAAMMTSVPGCSLVSLKSPEKPLSTRDLNARILTHEFSARFTAAVEQTADEMSAGTEDPVVRLNALRWKIAATGASQRAATQIAPMMGLLDTWALAVQMNEYLADGAGQSLLGTQQPRAVALAAKLAAEAKDLARRLTASEEFENDQRFIDEYARAHPIESLSFARASIVDVWTHDTGANVKLVDSLGTIPEAMAEARDLVRIYGDTAPSQVLWRAQLAALESGISGKDAQAALRRLNERMERLSALADAAPELVNGIVRDARKRVDASWAEMMGTVHTEGTALSAGIRAERQATVDAVDMERAAVAADAARLASQVIRDAGEEARRLVREMMLLAIALAVVVLGLPFVAGYFVGRARRSP
jgi:hypothetical protein